MSRIAGALLLLLGMGGIGSALIFFNWAHITMDRMASTRGRGWRFDKMLLVSAGVTGVTLATTTFCYNRAVVIWATGAVPPGVVALQVFAAGSLVCGVVMLLWVGGMGRRLWAFLMFCMLSSAWAAVVFFWTAGYIHAS